MEDMIKILGVNITTSSQDKVLEKIKKYIITTSSKDSLNEKTGKKALIIYTPNPEIVMYANRYKSFKEIVNKGQINIPDGAGIVWASRKIGKPIENSIPGVDLAYKIVKLASEEHVTVGLIGGLGKIALESLECLKRDFPRLRGWAEEGPKVSINRNGDELRLNLQNWDIDGFVKRAKEKKTRILLVALGYPKQELFIDSVSEKLTNCIIMAVGGTFDYWSGHIPRAPLYIRRHNLEWLYRLIKQPNRIKRQLSGSLFFLKVYTS